MAVAKCVKTISLRAAENPSLQLSCPDCKCFSVTFISAQEVPKILFAWPWYCTMIRSQPQVYKLFFFVAK